MKGEIIAMQQNRKCGSILGDKHLNSEKPDIMERAKRLDAIILVDTSGTMTGYQNLLTECVRKLYAEIMKDPQAKRAVELGVVTFNNYICIKQQITEIYKQKHEGNLEFECGGGTLTGHAVRKALSMLKKRRKQLEDGHFHVYPPILFIISDGDPGCPDDPGVQSETNEYLEEVIDEIREEVQARELTVVCFQIGEFATDVMKDLTGRSDGNLENVYYKLDFDKDEKVNSGKIKDFFKFASSFLISKSRA